MPIRQLFVVTIEFAGAAFFVGGAQPGREWRARDIRLIESGAGPSRRFTLHEGDGPAYLFSVQETAQLNHLLGQMGMKVPWLARAGMDGTDYELTLLAAMSCLTFRWWSEVPAEWQPVGAVFDYVVAVADGCRAGKADEGEKPLKRPAAG
ncbi:MAG: hypothetical protein ACOYZ7_16010 [Chloroflexota bacterium]